MRDIRRFTKDNWGQAQSARYIEEIYKRIELLAERPQIGIDRSGELGEGTRSCFVGSHTIYYMFDAETLTVLSVLHQAMTPGNLFEQQK